MTASQAYRQARIEGHTQQIFATMGAFRELYRKHGVDAVHRNRLRIHNAMDSLEAQLQQGTCKVAQEAQE